jgi:RES domain
MVPPEDHLPSHPEPPVDLNDRLLPIIEYSGPFYRINSLRYPSALHFDQSGCGRFDGSQQGYGILYVGQDEFGPFIESFGRQHGNRAVEESVLKQRYLAQIEANRPLKFADLIGNALVKIGADARLATGGSYDISRAWALAIFNHPAHVDGIRYFSRHDNERICFGIFDRAKSSLSEQNLGNLLEHNPQLLAEILEHYGYGLF